MIVDQLNNGVRGIKLSAVPSLSNPQEIHLCHTFCGILDAGPVAVTLNNITQWLKDNPKEIVTIMWNNLYDFSAIEIAATYEQSDIMPFVYTHPTKETSWPTLQELINTNKRVVNFVDSQADIDSVPWLMNQFSNVFETPYDNTDMMSFNCNVDRISQGIDQKDLMYVLNHFIYGVIEIGSLKIEVPYEDKAKEINSNSSLWDHVHQCENQFEKKPSFIEVDFYLIGDALDVVAELNEVEKPTTKTVQSFVETSSTVDDIKRKLLPTEHVIIDNLFKSNTHRVRYHYTFSFIIATFILIYLIY